MQKKKFTSTAKDVINLEIKALQNLKKKINNSFNEAVKSIAKCQSKVILCGVGKRDKGMCRANWRLDPRLDKTSREFIPTTKERHGDVQSKLEA